MLRFSSGAGLTFGGLSRFSLFLRGEAVALRGLLESGGGSSGLELSERCGRGGTKDPVLTSVPYFSGINLSPGGFARLETFE